MLNTGKLQLKYDGGSLDWLLKAGDCLKQVLLKAGSTVAWRGVDMGVYLPYSQDVN